MTITASGEDDSGYTPDDHARFMDTLTDEGRVVIIQENDTSTPTPNPKGGTITFDFGEDGAEEVLSIGLYQVSLKGSKVEVMQTNFYVTDFPVTNFNGDEIVNIEINMVDVQLIVVTLAEGSGGVSFLEICHEASGPLSPTPLPSTSIPSDSPSASPTEVCDYIEINFDKDSNGEEASDQYISGSAYNDYGVGIVAFGNGGSTSHDHARFMDTLTEEGRVVIIQNNDSTTPAPNPQGGTITFDFGEHGADEVVSISLYQVPAQGSKVEVIDVDGVLTEFPVTNENEDDIASIYIYVVNVRFLIVTLEGSGGVSFLEICQQA
jgi:hypothetical protein